MQAAKIQNIQALRGIAVLLVLFVHMQGYEKESAKFDFILPDYLLIGLSGVDLFFVISGFVMVIVTRGIYQSNGTIKQFLYHRVTRIYPLYWFYSALILCMYFVQPASVHRLQNNQVDVVSSLLLLPQDSLPLVTVGWTLIHEMYFYIIFALLLLLPKGKLLLGIILWLGSVVFVNNYYAQSSNAFIDVFSHPLTLEFIGGCLIGIMYCSRPLFGNAKLISILALFAWLLGYFSFQELSGRSVPEGWMRVLVFGVPAVLALYAGLLLEIKEKIIMTAWLRRIGDASYSIYLSHVFVLTAVGRVWLSIAAEGITDNVLMVFVMISTVLIAGFLSYHLIERVMLEKTRAIEKRLF